MLEQNLLSHLSLNSEKNSTCFMKGQLGQVEPSNSWTLWLELSAILTVLEEDSKHHLISSQCFA